MANPNEELMLAALKAEDEGRFKLNVLEGLATLLLMCHWLRGMFTWLHHTEAIKYPGVKCEGAENEMRNYRRLDRNLEIYEEMLWKFLPPRAMLQQLRLLRERGYLDEDFAKLLEADAYGRFDLQDANVCEVIRRGNEVDGRTDIPLR